MIPEIQRLVTEFIAKATADQSGVWTLKVVVSKSKKDGMQVSGSSILQDRPPEGSKEYW